MLSCLVTLLTLAAGEMQHKPCLIQPVAFLAALKHSLLPLKVKLDLEHQSPKDLLKLMQQLELMQFKRMMEPITEQPIQA